MSNILSGLEALGLGKMADIDLFGEDKEKKDKKPEVKKAEKAVVHEEDFLLDRSFKCPVCDNDYKSRAVRTGKARLVAQDLDLRPKYSDIDGLKYGVTVCPICGYSTMMKTFGPLASVQIKLVKVKIATSFTGLGPEKAIYSYDDAITRHKLALVNSVVKRAKISERAYLCLLIAWLLRGKAETLPEDTQDRDLIMKEIKLEENDFLAKARDGFIEAIAKETFPLCGLDEYTSMYLVGALCMETDMDDEALRWVSKLITSPSANDRIKERARTVKDMIAKKRAGQE